MLDEFKEYLIKYDKSQNTVDSYLIHVNQYLKWYEDSFGLEFKKLYRENILEFKSFLLNIKKQKANTINTKLSALISFNEFLIDSELQENFVLSKKDRIKIQSKGTSPTEITKKDVEKFRQQLLEQESIRNYAIVTLMAYCGTRISETLSIKLSDINNTTREIVIKVKGYKYRKVYMNDKVSKFTETFLLL